VEGRRKGKMASNHFRSQRREIILNIERQEHSQKRTLPRLLRYWWRLKGTLGALCSEKKSRGRKVRVSRSVPRKKALLLGRRYCALGQTAHTKRCKGNAILRNGGGVLARSETSRSNDRGAGSKDHKKLVVLYGRAGGPRD